MNAVAMHTISPSQNISSQMMTLSQTNGITPDNLQVFNNNNTIKQMDTSPDMVSPTCASAIGDGPASSPSSTGGTEDSLGKREPDGDAIKMFVGQVPKTMEESELREMFCKYGEIFQLNVLRDKVSGNHRGCCFVTFYARKSAIMAQDALHGKHTLAGMHHAIQMKPADNEKKNVEDRKLFIGMISKKLSENDIKQLFQTYGPIDDCMVLRDTSGASRGCAFVTYAKRDSALLAIQGMHHSQTMEGCSSPIVVKFADTQKDKDVRTKMPTNNNILGGNHYANSAGIPPGTHQYLALLQQTLGTPMGGSIAIPTSPLTNIEMASLQNYHNIQNMGMLTGQNLIGIQAISGAPLTMTRAVTSPTNGHQLGINSVAASFPHAYAPAPTALAADCPAGKQTEGPDGANLFIYHLPQEFTDIDLLQAFMPFGNVVSSKVFIDKQTNLSKCFGFVSYDNALSAQTAIATMNGFQVGMKRLKVQLKRPKNENKPY